MAMARESAAVRGARAIENFNRDNPVGTPVVFWPGSRNGDGIKGVTRTPAWTIGGHTAVVSVEGYAGGIYLGHVKVMTDNH